MSFLDPSALYLSALALPLVLLYFIRARRRDHRVPSLLLWQLEQHDRASSSFFQKLQLDPLLILQILALIALALAVARPTVTVTGEGERKVVIVLDASASMKARDVSPSRFAEAQSRAASLVRALRPGTETMVIEAGIQPRVLSQMSKESWRALDAIESAQAHDIPNGIDAALRIARALVGNDANAEIHMFTDGALDHVPEAEDSRIRWVGVGRGDDNVGITQLAVRRGYQSASSYEAFLSLANFSS